MARRQSAKDAREQPLIELFGAPELGNTTFLVADLEAGEAVTIDPCRDVDQYLRRAESAGLRIGHSLETHVHNDFVSGSRELAAAAGTRIGAAAGAGLEFDFDALEEGSEISIGRFRLLARRTPGHTPSHLSFVLADPAGRPLALFSGGALMVGSAARTDLFGPHLAVALGVEAFRTLHERLRDLPDEVAVYPTHGGGSFCGSGAGDASMTTMGRERLTNPLLLAGELMPFLARALHLGPHPDYYRLMTPLNRRGAPILGRSWPDPRPLSPDQLEALRAGGAAVVDIREPEEFDAAHIPGSYCIGMGDSFSAWVGWVVEHDRAIVLAGGTRPEQAAAKRQLHRIGYDTVAGALVGGIDAWRASGRAVRRFETSEMAELASWMESARPVTVLDVRDEDEWVHGHVPGAVHMRVPELAAQVHRLPAEAPVAVHCASGYRAGIAASLLEQAGLEHIVRVRGGYPDWEGLQLAATIPG